MTPIKWRKKNNQRIYSLIEEDTVWHISILYYVWHVCTRKDNGSVTLTLVLTIRNKT